MSADARLHSALDKIAIAAKVRATFEGRDSTRQRGPDESRTDTLLYDTAYERGRLWQQVQGLVDALQRYAQHHAWCESRTEGRCTCGLAAALEIGDR